MSEGIITRLEEGGGCRFECDTCKGETTEEGRKDCRELTKKYLGEGEKYE